MGKMMPPQKQCMELSLMPQHMGFKHLIIGCSIHSTLQDSERGDKDEKCHAWHQQHLDFTAESQHAHQCVGCWREGKGCVYKSLT